MCVCVMFWSQAWLCVTDTTNNAPTTKHPGQPHTPCPALTTNCPNHQLC